MGFLYSLSLKLLYPTSLCAVLILAAAVFRKQESSRRVCLWAALGVLMICGNGWVVGGLTKYLEGRDAKKKEDWMSRLLLFLTDQLDESALFEATKSKDEKKQLEAIRDERTIEE